MAGFPGLAVEQADAMIFREAEKPLAAEDPPDPAFAVRRQVTEFVIHVPASFLEREFFVVQ
jgi:hypothetical protein